MKKFYLFTIVISVIVLFVLFVYSAIVFYNGKKTLFPPDISPCPDNWKLDDNGKCKIPSPKLNSNLGYLEKTGVPIYIYKNINDKSKYSFLSSYYDIETDETYDGEVDPNLPLGYYSKDIPYGYDNESPEKGHIDFTDPGWGSYGDPYCEIKKWAKIQNIQWDGLLSYNNKC